MSIITTKTKMKTKREGAQWMSGKEASEATGISMRTLQKRASKGALQKRKIGKSQLNAYLIPVDLLLSNTEPEPKVLPKKAEKPVSVSAIKSQANQVMALVRKLEEENKKLREENEVLNKNRNNLTAQVSQLQGELNSLDAIYGNIASFLQGREE